ncbi:MAG: hypothetical protein JO272_16720 [Pseudonocardiales bacterium]|nr:hypothetical protein [Pseudonocardiales bacterium]
MVLVIRRGPSVYQANGEFMCKVLCKALADGVRAGLGTEDGIGSLRCRVSGALYVLLLIHQVDEQGRCQSCRRPGAMFGWRRRPCGVHREASFWLRQPDWFLASRGRPGAPVGPLIPTEDIHYTRDGDSPDQPGRHRGPTQNHPEHE